MPSENVLTRAFGANTFAVGEVVHVTADKTVARAQANAAPNVAGALGLSLGWTVVFGGVHPVLLEAGLVPVAGQTLYVSATQPGRATNVAPAMAVSIGTIFDASKYANTGTVVMVCALGSGAGAGGGGVVALQLDTDEYPGTGGAVVWSKNVNLGNIAARLGSVGLDFKLTGAVKQYGSGAEGDQGLIQLGFSAGPIVEGMFDEITGGAIVVSKVVLDRQWTPFTMSGSLAGPFALNEALLTVVLNHDQNKLVIIRDATLLIAPIGTL